MAGPNQLPVCKLASEHLADFFLSTKKKLGFLLQAETCVFLVKLKHSSLKEVDRRTESRKIGQSLWRI